MTLRMFTTGLFALMLLACSPAAEVEEAEEAADTEHVWQDQTDALDKARGVEDTLLDAEEKRRKQLEDDGG